MISFALRQRNNNWNLLYTRTYICVTIIVFICIVTQSVNGRRATLSQAHTSSYTRLLLLLAHWLEALAWAHGNFTYEYRAVLLLLSAFRRAHVATAALCLRRRCRCFSHFDYADYANQRQAINAVDHLHCHCSFCLNLIWLSSMT